MVSYAEVIHLDVKSAARAQSRMGYQCGAVLGMSGSGGKAKIVRAGDCGGEREKALRLLAAGRGKAEGGHFLGVADEEEAGGEDWVVPGFAFEGGDFGEFGEP